MKLLPFEYAVRNLGRSPTRLFASVLGSMLVVLTVPAGDQELRRMAVNGTATEDPLFPDPDWRINDVADASPAALQLPVGDPFHQLFHLHRREVQDLLFDPPSHVDAVYHIGHLGLEPSPEGVTNGGFDSLGGLRWEPI